MQAADEDWGVAAAIAASEAEAAETARVRQAEQVALDHALAESIAEAEAAEAAPLYAAARCGREADVAALLAGGGDVNELDPKGSGKTALYAACEDAHIEVVTVLIDAGAIVNQADNRGWTPLLVACLYATLWEPRRSLVVVAKLLAANANVDQARNDGRTPLYFACARGHLGIAQLLSSYGARRIFPSGETAEDRAAYYPGGSPEERRVRQQELRDWLILSRHWTPLHHLEFLTAERTRFLLRAGVDIHAAAGPGGPTPLSFAQDLEAAARPVIHSAFLVLEAAKPWSRETHHLFPAEARARAEELWPTGFRLSQQYGFPYEDVWMTIVIPREVTRDYHLRSAYARAEAAEAKAEAAEAKAAALRAVADAAVARAAAAAEAAREAIAAEAAAFAARPPASRKKKKLLKALRDIEKLKAKRAEGRPLEKTQEDKIEREGELLDELRRMEEGN